MTKWSIWQGANLDFAPYILLSPVETAPRDDRKETAFIKFLPAKLMYNSFKNRFANNTQPPVASART